MTEASSIHLRARGLFQTYDLGEAKLEVLKGVNLDVNKGEVVFLRGASGAGKSTLLYILAAQGNLRKIQGCFKKNRHHSPLWRGRIRDNPSYDKKRRSACAG